MEKKKDSFILYEEYYEPIKMLSTADKGMLLAALYEYHMNGVVIELPQMARVIFQFIKQRMDYNQKRYNEICEARSAAGSLGGRPKKQEVIDENTLLDEKTKKANGFLEKQNNQKKAKKAILDMDKDMDIYNPPISPLNVDKSVDNFSDEKGRKEEKIYISPDYHVAWDERFTVELRSLNEHQIDEIDYWLQKKFSCLEIPAHIIRNAVLTKSKRESEQASGF